MIPAEEKMLRLLSKNDVTFFIPPYQRNYEWTDTQCAVFLEDVVKTYNANISGKRTEHFFGSITYFQSGMVFGQPAKLVLIDGQQRITTVMLFLTALRDILDDDKLKSFINTNYLKNERVTDETEYKIKLKQVEMDWIAYKKIILSEEITDQEKNSAVYKNYKYFCSRLENLMEDGVDLSGLIENGINFFSVITIELQPDKNEWENPQEIFESMNSLGKPLYLSDLVRNYLMLGFDADLQDELYEKYWLKIENTIPKRVSDLIRDYIQEHEKRAYPKATEANHKALYGYFKSIFAETDKIELLKDLADHAKIYSYIILNGSSTGNKNIDRELKDLNYMKITTAYSFLMSLLFAWSKGRFSDEDLTSILRVFKTYCMRRRIISGLTSAENKNFPQLSKWIPELEKAENKQDKMFEILANQESNLRLPNDIELTRYMETMNFYNFGYCKFYLALIEETMTKSRPELSDENLQIEHILPQTLNDKWSAALGEGAEEIHSELVNTIGNLTLIRHNQELGQKDFKTKKDTYETKAGLQIARTEITNNDKWDADTIKHRTKWITEYLLTKVLTIPEHMRKTNNFTVKDSKGVSFQNLQLIGLDIHFVDDPSIVAHVVSDKEVEFKGKKWRLSPLTREIMERKGVARPSGAYNGYKHWAYDEIILSEV